MTQYPAQWVTKSVYCYFCGHDWQAVFDEVNVEHLECPNCHSMTRPNIMKEA